jgi:hypothetical protein
VSKREAVRLLASTIRGLQGKGYRLDKIAELVSQRGVTIKPTTLKSYLHPVKARGKAARRTNRRREIAAGEATTEQVSQNVDDLEATIEAKESICGCTPFQRWARSASGR